MDFSLGCLSGEKGLVALGFNIGYFEVFDHISIGINLFTKYYYSHLVAPRLLTILYFVRHFDDYIFVWIKKNLCISQGTSWCHLSIAEHNIPLNLSFTWILEILQYLNFFFFFVINITSCYAAWFRPKKTEFWCLCMAHTYIWNVVVTIFCAIFCFWL